MLIKFSMFFLCVCSGLKATPGMDSLGIMYSLVILNLLAGMELVRIFFTHNFGPYFTFATSGLCTDYLNPQMKDGICLLTVCEIRTAKGNMRPFTPVNHPSFYIQLHNTWSI